MNEEQVESSGGSIEMRITIGSWVLEVNRRWQYVRRVGEDKVAEVLRRIAPSRWLN